MNSLWLVITSLAAFLVAYRLYGAFLATRVAVLNDERLTPAHRLRDNVDYCPTRRLVLFGAHFAAIAGAGPLLGPVLAAQWGYLPGFTWIVVGACLAGGVHDFVVLLASVRQDGLSLPKIAAKLLGPISGTITPGGHAVRRHRHLGRLRHRRGQRPERQRLGDVHHRRHHSRRPVDRLLDEQDPAGPRRRGLADRRQPGALGRGAGQAVRRFGLRQYLLFSKPTLSIILPVYAAIASILPVWVLLCPRGYLSSYMKIGVIAVLAVGIFAARPLLKMPATTPFIRGDGPVVPGTVWPFVCIVIMCGALSGFHALVSSGTTPKMIDRESDIRIVGYGGMLVEGFVSITALIAACSLEPGDYFKINVNVAETRPHGRDGQGQVRTGPAAEGIRRLAGEHGQGATGRQDGRGRDAGGGHGQDLRQPARHEARWSYCYHFIIMFEALFILTLLETGTRGPAASSSRRRSSSSGRSGPAGAGPTGCSTSPPARWSASCGDTCSTRAASKTSGG